MEATHAERKTDTVRARFVSAKSFAHDVRARELAVRRTRDDFIWMLDRTLVWKYLLCRS